MRLRLGAILRSHAAVSGVIAGGLALRVLTQIAYGPALYYYDSLAYLTQANGWLFSNAGEPAGYPLAIRLFRLAGANLAVLIAAQHLAGLAAGLLVYVVVFRLTERRTLGAVGAAIVVLDGYWLAVEQYVMTDAFFGLLLMTSVALTLLARRRGALVAAGIVLAAACLVRATGFFCVPVWLAFVAWRQRWSLASLLCGLAVLVPLLGYAAINDGQTGHFALTDDTAWLLYARVGSIGDCKGLSIPPDERILCPQRGQLHRGVNYYLEANDSPAARAFGRPAVGAPAHVDRVLLGYALRVIEQRPLRYVGLVGESLADFFVPGAPNDSSNLNGAITLPKHGPWLWPFYHPPARWPSGALRAYARVIHTVRPLLALLLGTAALALAFGARGGVGVSPRPSRSAIALPTGMAAALLLGAALGHFELRYALPSVPLLACAGMLGCASLSGGRRAWAS